MGKTMPGPDAFGVDAAAGAEEVEGRMTLASCGAKPGGGAWEDGKRDTLVAMPAGMGVRGTPPKTGTVVVGTGLTPKPPVGRAQGMSGMLENGTIDTLVGAACVCDAEVFPSESRKAVKSSLGSGGRDGMILIQVFGIFSRACCITVAKPKFVK